MYDAIVIGGSFAGLSAAMQLARARRRTLVVDAGQPRNRFAPTSHGFLGQDGKRPADIIGEARFQLTAYPTVQFINAEVVEARREGDGFAVVLADRREVVGARLILAIGQRDELPDLPGLQARWGVSVLHCPYCHGYEVGDRALGVLATSAMSQHQALLIPDWGRTTYFTQGIHAPDEAQAALLAARGVRVEASPIVELLGSAPDLEGVRLADGRVVPLRAIFTGTRTQLACALPSQLGCALEEGPLGPLVRVDEHQQTSVEGVYAAGDASNARSNATLASAAGVLAGVGAHQSLIRAEALGAATRSTAA